MVTTITKQITLKMLQDARGVLNKSYVKWSADDGHGGHCAMGALIRAVTPITADAHEYMGLVRMVNETARALHPELAGRKAKRDLFSSGDGFDYFDNTPTVYVNNHLDKAATLKIFDVTITELALELDNYQDVKPRYDMDAFEEVEQTR